MGQFIVIDGPNGAGKTTVIDLLCNKLTLAGEPLVRTKEPTNSELGSFIRSKQNVYSKEILALLVAANRFEHIETLIKPELANGKMVISDRYLPSSLVYQMLDGVAEEYVLELNRNALVPDLVIILTAEVTEINRRMNLRPDRTRFENDPVKELNLYEKAISTLRLRGWRIETIDNTFSADESVHSILQHIRDLPGKLLGR